MTCLTCTCHVAILEFVVFLPNFMLFQIEYHRRHMGKPSFLSYRQALAKDFRKARHLDVGLFRETDAETDIGHGNGGG